MRAERAALRRALAEAGDLDPHVAAWVGARIAAIEAILQERTA